MSESVKESTSLPALPRTAVDARSLLGAMLGAAGFLVLGVFCLSIAHFDSTLASVWLPNAFAASVLFLARLHREWPFYIGIVAAGITANLLSGNPMSASFTYAFANIVDIALVTWLTRKFCSAQPDMTDPAHLVRFLLFAGIVGPVGSAMVAATSILASGMPAWPALSSWFIADSIGMLLVVPAALLVADMVRLKSALDYAELIQRAALITSGLIAVCAVFAQNIFPVLFLLPHVTLLMAFRLGSLGTAIYVPCAALVASWMTYIGYGPIAQTFNSDIGKMYVLQAFIVANFISGLPVAAILAGRARMMEAISEREGELALLAENVTDAVVRLNNDGLMTYASRSVRDVLGREPEQLVGEKVTKRTHEDASDRIASLLERMREGETEKERLTYRRLKDAEDGSPVFIEADCAVAYDPETGERNGFVVSARDVTERVELELLLTRARKNAENAAHAKSEFLANMSHEIRTPMNGVLGFAELILQGDLEEEHRRHTEMIVQSGRSMMLLLNDILDLSKIEAGQIAIDHTSVDLYATVEECVALHGPTAEKKGLQITVLCGEDDRGDKRHPWIKTDALRLRQIILNLVGNAVKFTEEGWVEVSCWVDDRKVCVEITDTGIGISPHRLDSIFSPFTQAESDTARRFGGTGLGLTISRQLAELLGGTIEVESQPGHGSTFRLSLPFNPAEPQGEVIENQPALEPPPMPQSARILLVEDHDVNRLLGTEMLERCGQDVETAHDGNEAIAMVIDSLIRGKPFDLVLMDIQMPGCDGYAATRAIRAEGITAATMPIIALTANAFPEDIAAARDAGMQSHLAKPLVFADLARALQRWLPTRIVEHDAIETAAPLREEAETEAPSCETPLTHSPDLLRRWTERRAEAIEAVREALRDGTFADPELAPKESEKLARLVHKLAGTAAIFGEPELGKQATRLERALRLSSPPEVCEDVAFKLLSLADDPEETLAASSSR